MKAAVVNGDARKLAELIRQDPGFDVNAEDGDGDTLLYVACLKGNDSVIPLLLAHPYIDVNSKGGTLLEPPFMSACRGGHTACARLLLKDSRVVVNESNDFGFTTLRNTSEFGHLDVIKWWIASGRYMDLGEPGNYLTDAIGEASAEVGSLLERFKSETTQTRHAMRVDVGWYDEAAAEMFALVVFVSDGLLQTKDTTTPSPAARFFILQDDYRLNCK